LWDEVISELLAARCAVRLPMVALRVLFSVAGVVFNSLALTVVVADKELGRPFKMVVSSLIIADLSFAAVTVIVGVLAAVDMFRLTEVGGPPFGV
jgi:hypothetical protein